MYKTTKDGKKSGKVSKNAEAENSDVRQLLGMKGAALETDINKIRLQLTKPVTWIPLIWGACVVKRSCGFHPHLSIYPVINSWHPDITVPT